MWSWTTFFKTPSRKIRAVSDREEKEGGEKKNTQLSEKTQARVSAHLL